MKKSNLYQRESKEETVLKPSNQVEKFNARVAKRENDTNAIVKGNMDKDRESSSFPENLEELKKSGSIEEAAVVFSHSGMHAFAKIFSNSMEVAVERVLKDRMNKIMADSMDNIGNIVESKMVEMLNGMSKGMQEFAEGEVDTIISKHSEPPVEPNIEEERAPEPPVVDEKLPTIEDIGKSVPKMDLLGEIPEEVRRQLAKQKAIEENDFKAYAEARGNSNKITPSKPEVEQSVTEVVKSKHSPDYSIEGLEFPKKLPKYTRLSTKRAHVEIAEAFIVPILKKNEGKAIRSTLLLGTMREYNIGIINFTVVMTRLIAKYPQIEKVEFGVYKYEEKTFKPTN